MRVEPELTLTPIVGPPAVQELLARHSYSARALMRLTGMTRKQVTYWAQIGLVKPSVRDPGSGRRHPALFYSGTETVKALIICELRRAGFSPRQVQQVARNLQEQDIQLYESESYLLTDGYSVYFASDHDQVVDVLKQHRQMLLLLPIYEQVARLTEVA